MGFNSEFVRQVGFFRWFSRCVLLQWRKRILKRDGKMRLPTGGMIILPRHSGSASEVYITNADLDWGAEALFAQSAQKDRDFIDVGAHIGYYSLYLAPLVRRVYAFEPDPRNISALRANAALTDNVEVVETALSSRVGTAALTVDGSSATSTIGGGGALTVPVTTLDEFLRGRADASIGLIKTDIEGHDIEALRGMTETVAKHQPLILTECDSRESLQMLCAEWHYEIYAVTRDPMSLATEFRKMSDADLRDRWYKMLFLVPNRLAGAFAPLLD